MSPIGFNGSRIATRVQRGYEGEHVYMPLGDMSVTREDVNAFWGGQSWGLGLSSDTSLSNCVYCFLKGTANLAVVRHRMETELQAESPGFGPLDDTPSDLRWWRRIEGRYSRDLIKEEREVRSAAKRIGFFGAHPFGYDELASGRDLSALHETMLPCDCTE